jgi:3-deoxy-D-manno-octulosonic acid kinase
VAERHPPLPAGFPPLPAGFPPLPAGFVWVTRGADAFAAADGPLAAALRAQGLLDPSGVRRALADGVGWYGRARAAAVALGEPGTALVLRGLRRGGLFGPLLGGALLGPARPFRELAATAALHAAGAPVPRPAAAMAWRHGPVWNAAVATRLEAGALDAGSFLASDPTPACLRAALEAAGRAVRRFHDAGGSHRDLHIGNLLVRVDPCEALVIDLDGARVGSRLEPEARMAELMRLYRSLRKRDLLGRVGERGSLAFFRAYVGGDRTLRRALLARLRAEQRHVAIHALHYRNPRPSPRQ